MGNKLGAVGLAAAAHADAEEGRRQGDVSIAVLMVLDWRVCGIRVGRDDALEVGRVNLRLGVGLPSRYAGQLGRWNISLWEGYGLPCLVGTHEADGSTGDSLGLG